LKGTIAPTARHWYEFLCSRQPLDEVNFWKPSAEKAFRGEPMSPFFFKLKAPDRAVCGFGLFVRYARLPDWMAWECFGAGNGCTTFEDLRAITQLRKGMNYRPTRATGDIGCIIISSPVFFSESIVGTSSSGSRERRHSLSAAAVPGPG